MKKFFILAVLLTYSLNTYAFCPEIFTEKEESIILELDKYVIDISIDNLKGFKKLVKGKNINGLEYYGCDRRKYKVFYDKGIPFLAFIRSIKDNTISLYLAPDLYELSSSEVVEQINLHIKDNVDVNQKSIYFTREMGDKSDKETCVDPVICYWGEKTEIKIPDVGKWANQYSSKIIPTEIKLKVLATLEL